MLVSAAASTQCLHPPPEIPKNIGEEKSKRKDNALANVITDRDRDRKKGRGTKEKEEDRKEVLREGRKLVKKEEREY